MSHSKHYSQVKTPPSILSPKSGKSNKSVKSIISAKSASPLKLSEIDNVHARSPSLHSSIRQSPSPPRSNSHSPSQKAFRSSYAP